MLWLPVLVLLLIAASTVGFQVLKGWRARDLAAKAVASAKEGNVQAARLQAWSASNLRKGDPQVLRALAVVATAAASPDAAKLWEEMPGNVTLSEDDLEARAVAMARSGSQAKFLAALTDLESAGLGAVAARLRAEHGLSRGDLETAIKEARAGAQHGDEKTKLMLLRLLVARYGPFLQPGAQSTAEDIAAGGEIAGLVDALIDTPHAPDALVLGFSSQQLDDGQARAWAAAAWREKKPSNPSLLPAATQLVRLGDVPRDEMRGQLKSIYAGASASQRAALASWFMAQGDVDSALESVPAVNTAQSAAAFVVRAEALEAAGRWKDLLALGESVSIAPSSLRLAAVAHAARNLGYTRRAEKGMRDALRAAPREGTLLQIIAMADSMGAGDIVDTEIMQLCDAPQTADPAFRLARDRFERRGQFASLTEALQKAAAAAPNSTSVADYRRFDALLSGENVDPQETAAAVEAEPTLTERRMTHALALLKAGRPQDALAVFDEFDVVVENLPPPQRAVAVAVIAGNGHSDVAARLAANIDRQNLPAGALALIAPSLRVLE
jgi:tetratricopeptide (TPR) repeat protein